ncbi:hypothetical protein ERHA55_52660 (plasmid) [Erwinia rhapontici]|nr:DJ-1/PfpI family protein [Erwinia rhapontici]BCQ47739.1 hypothetical protein ERHA55_52660 [Erwinia rhapontici]
MDDDSTLAFIRHQSQQARLVTSVCTGSLILGRQVCFRDIKPRLTGYPSASLLVGAEPVSERVVRDGNRITGAGVTSGIDFALYVVAELYGVEIAQNIQLGLEYDPEPPFNSGSPHSAPQEQVRQMRERLAPFIEKRRLATLKSAGRLKG